LLYHFRFDSTIFIVPSGFTDSIAAICPYVLLYSPQVNSTIHPATGVVFVYAFLRASRLFPPGVASIPQSSRANCPHSTHTSVQVGISIYFALVGVGAFADDTLPAFANDTCPVFGFVIAIRQSPILENQYSIGFSTGGAYFLF
jgi:hypothetical protein